MRGCGVCDWLICGCVSSCLQALNVLWTYNHFVYLVVLCIVLVYYASCFAQLVFVAVVLFYVLNTSRLSKPKETLKERINTFELFILHISTHTYFVHTYLRKISLATYGPYYWLLPVSQATSKPPTHTSILWVSSSEREGERDREYDTKIPYLCSTSSALLATSSGWCKALFIFIYFFSFLLFVGSLTWSTFLPLFSCIDFDFVLSCAELLFGY